VTLVRAAALVLAVVAGVVGICRGTWAVGGSDSSCYGLMAQAFARGSLQPTADLALEAPWPMAPATFAPGGFIPSPRRAAASSPVCAPGFSLLLAPFYALAGPDAIFLLTPFAGSLLVYLTFLLGTRLMDEVAAFAASVLVAASPVFVFQVVQPMNDVVVAALWVAIVVLCAQDRDRPTWVGVLTGAALLVRPNLAPAAVVVGVWFLRNGTDRLAKFVAASAPALLLLVALNTWLYGHPLGSGYGSPADLFAWSHLPVNLENYGRSLVLTQLGFPLIGLAAIIVARGSQRSIVGLSSAMALAIIGVYLLYRPLPEWWYLRFFLPALPVLTVLAIYVLTSLMAMSVARQRTIAAIVTAVIGAYGASSFAMREALDLHRLEQRFRLAGTVARDRLPAHSVYLTVWESGSVRFHADREVVVWDSLDPSSLETGLQWLTARGREPYIMIEDWEEPVFRERFSTYSPIGQLDWPPRYAIDRRVRIYRPADRALYWEGGAVPTTFVNSDRR
jgi:hypothetical protein